MVIFLENRTSKRYP